MLKWNTLNQRFIVNSMHFPNRREKSFIAFEFELWELAITVFG
jgi:hypothetical protein